MVNELLIAGLSLIHIAIHLKWKRIEYKMLYLESAILLIIGLLDWILYVLIRCEDIAESLFWRPDWYFPVEPIDLIFIGLSLLLSTLLLDFITKFYDLDRKGLLAILPWTITGQYRFLHELIWVFHFWITNNVLNRGFRDVFDVWVPALLTHSFTILFTIFTIFNFAVILQAFTKKSYKTWKTRYGENSGLLDRFIFSDLMLLPSLYSQVPVDISPNPCNRLFPLSPWKLLLGRRKKRFFKPSKIRFKETVVGRDLKKIANGHQPRSYVFHR
jgi:hypothetical protein